MGRIYEREGGKNDGGRKGVWPKIMKWAVEWKQWKEGGLNQ